MHVKLYVLLVGSEWNLDILNWCINIGFETPLVRYITVVLGLKLRFFGRIIK